METSLDQQVINLLKYDIPDDVIINFLKTKTDSYNAEIILYTCKQLKNDKKQL